jgi:protein-S-isoprenylcysteine O-methyltransferase Ste14
MLRVVLFLGTSVAILPLSWRSLRNVRAHGFYRFFAFELLLALILLNSPVWFRAPFSARQWTAWSLGTISIGLAIEGFRLLYRIGRPGPVAVESTNLPLENTTILVTTGAYRWIRHPLYASLLALALCAYFKDPQGKWSILLTLGVTSFLLLTATAEEKENIQRFGAVYRRYMRSTKRFIPYIF